MYDKQIELRKQLGEIQLREVDINADTAADQVALAMTRPIGIKWVDAYVATVRPTVTYLLFLIWIVVKFWQWHLLQGLAPLVAAQQFWTDTEMGLLSYLLCPAGQGQIWPGTPRGKPRGMG
ncbi:MAG: hypothetical protein KGL39_06725 [Patescibacteria group bacterium]|nr:hypothetical protein [Patescibacteria group bacterium]